MPLIKIALDAMKAREMAKAVGLVPHPGSQWKWALRNMRDGRGDMLQGRELAEAKEGMGKLPNNVRQQTNAASRATGHRYEVATAVKKDNPEWEALSSRVDLTSPSLEARQALNGADDLQDFANAKQDLIDRARRIFPGYEAYPDDQFLRDLSAHRKQQIEEWSSSFLKNHRQGKLNFGDEDSVSAKNIDTADVANHVHTHIHSPLRKHDKPPAGIPWEVVKAHRQSSSTGAPLVYPSGFTTRKVDREPYGDLKFMEGQEVQNPNTIFNILDPRFGNEGVHKMRPQGLRSIYFKNQT